MYSSPHYYTSLSPPVIQPVQLSVQVPEGGGERRVQTPMGPFYTLNEEANHFTQV